MRSSAQGADVELVLALWGFKTWVEVDLDEGTIIASDFERHTLRLMLRRIDRLAAAVMGPAATGGSRP
ncbi:MAG: hypothetical protein ACRDKW_04165 [Actinomycetota bacterium]